VAGLGKLPGIGGRRKRVKVPPAGTTDEADGVPDGGDCG
jgi:hypothetical protein